jgi:nucleotide-binding universal stress UspA family protein
MPSKLLIPVDGSAGSVRAVEYVAETFGQMPEVQFVLLHILPKLPPSMWDDGHILTEEEHLEREVVIEDWKEQEGKPWESMINEAREKLIQGGVTAEAVNIKYQPTYSDIAADILDEAELEGCSTIVIGRHGTTGARKLFMGSISQKVVDHAKGIAVTIVDQGESEEPPETRALLIRERRLLQAKVKEKKVKEKQKKKDKEKKIKERKVKEKKVKEAKAEEPVVPLFKRLANYLKKR